MNVKELFAFNKLINQFGKDVDDTFDYNFRTTNVSDFEIILRYKAKSKVLDNVFRQVSKVLSRTQNKFAKLKASDPRHIEKFDIPEDMYNRVKTAVHKNVVAVSKEVGKDGFVILRHKVIGCTFYRRDNNNIEIEVHIEGQYIRK